MITDKQTGIEYVHCRTGSLENIEQAHLIQGNVHCRTGSLEKWWTPEPQHQQVHCRTGSLESV